MKHGWLAVVAVLAACGSAAAPGGGKGQDGGGAGDAAADVAGDATSTVTDSAAADGGPTCSGKTAHVWNGQCVECALDSDCPGTDGTCDKATHTCLDPCAKCTGATPYCAQKPGGQVCVECVDDSGCKTSSKGPVCHADSGTCGPGSCDLCTGATPKCLQSGGNVQCVQCLASGDCLDGEACGADHTCGGGTPGGCGTCAADTPKCFQDQCVECLADTDCYLKGKMSCDQGSHTCGNGTVNPPPPAVIPPGPATGTCASDADCQNSGGSSFTLHCDPTTGLCYDEGGKCDNVVAFCNVSAGSECVAAAGGLPGGIPGIPGGGGASGPQCSCPLPGDASGTTSTDPLPNQNCKIAAMLDPTVKNCDCTKDPHAPACTVKSPLDPNPIDCCQSSPSGSGGGNPMDCLSLPPAKPSPACFGGIQCGQSLMQCLSGGTDAVCGPSGGAGFP